MVHLGHQRRPLALEPLDHVHLPQRSVGVELAAHHAGDEGVELGLAAGRRQAGPAQVVVEVEVGIVDPHRVVQSEGHPQGPLAQRGDQVEALLNHPADLRVPGRRREERAGALRRVEHERHADVHRCRGRLEREEGGVHPDECLHDHPLLSVSAARPSCARVPEPAAPPLRLLQPASATVSNVASSTLTMTSWAIRSPRLTV